MNTYLNLLVKDRTSLYTACDLYRKQFEDTQVVVGKYMEDVGAELWYADYRGIISVVFKLQIVDFKARRVIPEGWTKPDVNYRSRPILNTRAGKLASEALNRLPKYPNPWAIYNSFGIPTNLKASYATGSISRGLLRDVQPSIEWMLLNGKYQYVLEIENIKKILMDLENYADLVVEDGLDKWEVPEDLSVISDARKNYMFAKARLQEEDSNA